MVWAPVDELTAWLSGASIGTAAAIAAVWAVAAALRWATNRLYDRVDDRLTRFNVPERRLSKLDTLTDVLLIALAALVTLYLLGVAEALWGALALTSIAGVVAGLAARRFGENMIAGAVILFERPFEVGDAVTLGDHSGTVRSVTLHSTTLSTFDGPQVTVPNQRVLDGAVVNLTVPATRRVSVDVEVDVGADKLDDARFAIRQAVLGDAHVAEDEDPLVFVSASLDEGVRFTARYWVDADHYASHCKPTSLRRVLEGLEREGFDTALPTQRVHVRR
jgi:small conductance mechanosensitive channel